jgi:hypothetical protein
MEPIADGYIMGHSFSVRVTCKIRSKILDMENGLSKPVKTWDIFDVSQSLPDGIYTVAGGGYGARRMALRDGYWSPPQREATLFQPYA